MTTNFNHICFSVVDSNSLFMQFRHNHDHSRLCNDGFHLCHDGNHLCHAMYDHDFKRSCDHGH
jgi:hypothetical protein